MALTTAQITHIRNNTGDTDTASPNLDDTYLQYLYDNDGDSDLDQTIYYAVRALLGIAAQKVSTSNSRTGDSKSSQQWFEHLQSLEKTWGYEEDSQYDIS